MDLSSRAPLSRGPIFKGSTSHGPSSRVPQPVDLFSRVPDSCGPFLHGFHILWTYLWVSGYIFMGLTPRGPTFKGSTHPGPSFMDYTYRGPISKGSASHGAIFMGWLIFVRSTSHGPMFHGFCPTLRRFFFTFYLFISWKYDSFIYFYAISTSYSLYIYIPSIRQHQFSVLYPSVEAYLQLKCINLWTWICTSFYLLLNCFCLQSLSKMQHDFLLSNLSDSAPRTMQTCARAPGTRSGDVNLYLNSNFCHRIRLSLAESIF